MVFSDVRLLPLALTALVQTVFGYMTDLYLVVEEGEGGRVEVQARDFDDIVICL